MSVRWQLSAVTLCLTLAAASTLHAQIYRWDNGQVIPGTEGIWSGPGVDLSGWNTEDRNLRYAEFSGGANLTGAMFSGSWLDYADFSGALLPASQVLTDVDLTGASVTGTNFRNTGISKAQLESTANYPAKDLRWIALGRNDLTGWDFLEQNLANADFRDSTLANANLVGAVVTGADFSHTTFHGFTQAQLKSTASYQAKSLQGIGLSSNDLTGWDFSEQSLANANFSESTLANANLTGAVVMGADFSYTTSYGFAQAQLTSTTSYQVKDLQGIHLSGDDLSGWDFSGQNLTGANLTLSTLTNANLSGANLKNAYLGSANRLPTATVDATTVYNQWTVFPAGFDPAAAGLTLVMSHAGDLDADDTWDADDVDMVASKIRGDIDVRRTWWLPNAVFDPNGDSSVDLDDHRVWVKDLAHTWYGDADLNGEFNSSDFVQVFAAGKYEKGPGVWSRESFMRAFLDYVGWSEGDWNGDGVFTSDDFITAFQDGGYEQGPRTDAAAVPEPSGAILLLCGLAGVMRRKRTVGAKRGVQSRSGRKADTRRASQCQIACWRSGRFWSGFLHGRQRARRMNAAWQCFRASCCWRRRCGTLHDLRPVVASQA